MPNPIHKAYMSAGSDFLAVRLARVFTKIENEEDRILHNDMLADVLAILEGPEKKKTFFKNLAQSMLTGKKQTKNQFLRRMAQRILNVGQ